MWSRTVLPPRVLAATLSRRLGINHEHRTAEALRIPQTQARRWASSSLFVLWTPLDYDGLTEFTWAAERKRVAFLGSMTAEERDDARRVCPDRLLLITSGSGLTMHGGE